MARQANQSQIAAGNQAYLFPFVMPDGNGGYVYLMCDARFEAELSRNIRSGSIPDFATVIACGRGQPDERLRYNMERYYGCIHEQLAAA